MIKKKEIKVRHGKIKVLAEICKVSERTVHDALRWRADSDVQNLVRKRAYDMGFVRRF